MSGAQTALDRQPFCSVGAAGCEHVRADSEGLRPTLGLRTALTCSDGLHTSSQYQPAHPEARERVKLKIQPNLPPSVSKKRNPVLLYVRKKKNLLTWRCEAI